MVAHTFGHVIIYADHSSCFCFLKLHGEMLLQCLAPWRNLPIRKSKFKIYFKMLKKSNNSLCIRTSYVTS
jgi:hypothetical protein